jgi:eukaryotic-like serine/threonine-protein kinase
MAEPSPDPLFFAFQQAVIGRYSLERELGRGGMGVVYLAREVRLDRPVAIKLLPPEYAARPELRDRFMREARTAARLSHPYIVPIHAVEEIDGFVFIVMAYVDGGTLAQRVASHGPLPPADVSRIMREVAWALAYAHAQGVVHRDIKPANILLEHGSGRAMVADFGIARLTETSGDTAAGVVMGTPEFMSPEQAMGEELDGRSDLYALAVVAWFALTAKLPFTAPTVQGVLALQLNQAAPSVVAEGRGVPRPLAQAIDRCLKKDPGARFTSGEALADALAEGLERRAEAPIPVRLFLDRRRMTALVIPLAFMPVLSSVWVYVNTHVVHTSPAIGLALAVLFVGGTPLAVLVHRLRNLMRHGYGLDDILAGLRTGFERRREIFLYEFGLQPTARERTFRIGGVVALVAGGAAAAASALPGAAFEVLMPSAFVAAYIGIVGIAFARRWRQLREGTPTVWSKFWAGRPGRALTKLAKFRLGNREVPADRPTELAIAMNAEAMFEAFPKELRESLGDVPDVLRGLEAHARLARARIEALDASIAEAQRTAGGRGAGEKQRTLVADLTSARDDAETRLADLVTALENVRLDLLRLRAGAGSVEGITIDLAAARDVGENADRMIAGGREVERALRSPRTPV